MALLVAAQHLLAGVSINGYECPTEVVQLNTITSSTLPIILSDKTYLLAAGGYSLSSDVTPAVSTAICIIGTSSQEDTISTVGQAALVLPLNGATLGLQGLTLDGAQSDGSEAGGVAIFAGSILTAKDIVMQSYAARSALFAANSPVDIRLASVVFRDNNSTNYAVYVVTPGGSYEWSNVSVSEKYAQDLRAMSAAKT